MRHKIGTRARISDAVRVTGHPREAAGVLSRRAAIGGIVGGLALTSVASLLPTWVDAADDIAGTEPWRKLIPPVPPPPKLGALTPPLSRPDLVQFVHLCRETAAALARTDGWVMPSGWYPMLFTRDAYWITAAHRDPNVHAAVLKRLRVEQNRTTGQAPTALYIDGYNPPGRDQQDECTLLFVMMTYDAARLGLAPDRASLERAFAYLKSRTFEGRYLSQPGPYAYWLDTLAIAGDLPSVTYVQGLYAVALRALQAMGIAGADPTLAEQVYRSTFDPALGQLRCYTDRSGLFGQFRDISALAGEGLSWHYFGRPILDRPAVESTLDRQPKGYFPDGQFVGFKNLAMADGRSLPIAWMSEWPANLPGDYQNGASWILYDALALYSGVRHGIPAAAPLLLQRIASETRRRPSLHEYIMTSDANPGGSETKREGYGWSAFVGNLVESVLPAL